MSDVQKATCEPFTARLIQGAGGHQHYFRAWNRYLAHVAPKTEEAASPTGLAAFMECCPYSAPESGGVGYSAWAEPGDVAAAILHHCYLVLADCASPLTWRIWTLCLRRHSACAVLWSVCARALVAHRILFGDANMGPRRRR